ncbi:MAG TPA: T9SS type A sorting domain-containing protein, partial [Bacteroidales bacterium]|nr:T9SS type A sorting domain-containing protein [Bacteroidales bacterium]
LPIYIIYMNVDTADIGSASASVETMFLNEVMDIYPNPASDNLSISFNTNMSSDYVVSIITVLGDVVSSYNVNSNGFDVKTINISDLPAGIYMVQVSNEKGSTTKKLIKN